MTTMKYMHMGIPQEGAIHSVYVCTHFEFLLLEVLVNLEGIVDREQPYWTATE